MVSFFGSYFIRMNMKKNLFSFLCLLLLNSSFAQPIPTDSLFLGQRPPGKKPTIFKLQVAKGLVAGERIAITMDNKEIYYGELDSWPSTIQRIKCYKYLNNRWQGPFVAFEGYIAPSLSINDSIMYMQKYLNKNKVTCTYYSIRTETGWTKPTRIFSTNPIIHYFQETNLKNYYLSSILPDPQAGNSDIFKMAIHGSDTTLQSLGKLINTSATENDFYIARDESYMIICRFNSGSASDLYISYRSSDGSWTEPVSLGKRINTLNPNWEACPFVTKDNKYLFFMRGGNDLSSYHIYWVSIHKIIDRLKNKKTPNK